MKDVHEVLREYWGYGNFRPVQEDVVHSVLAGQDTLALLPTGGGKSLCFQVPALAMQKLCIVISPLIALMRDQVGRLKKQGIPARAIVSGMTHAEIENALDSAVAGKLSFLYVSPERLGTDHFRGRVGRMPIGLIAVDEAHCISQWGYDFRPSYLKIAELREVLPQIPVLALTASATADVATDIMHKLAFRTPHVIRANFDRPELVLWVSKGEDKQGRMLKILQNIPGTSLIYMRDRKGTVRTAHFLKHHSFNAAAYHAGMPAGERDRVQKEWTAGTLRIVTATNAFGMGIDKPDVRSVIHMEAPSDLESYYQEAGRAGRDGKTAYAFLLVGPGDEERLRERLEVSFPPLTDVRRVYQAFADLNGIAIGSGEMETYPVDIHAIAERLGARVALVSHSLKALELDGRIVLSEGVRSPSRMLITAPASTVYHLRVNDQRLGPLLEALLRLYGGLFEEPAVIDEIRVARHLQWQVDSVVERAQELDRMGVISYKRRSDAPTVTLMTPREDAAKLQLDPVALRDRRARAERRLEAMIDHMNNTDRCRAVVLLEYFGEQDPSSCGRCDVCRGMRRASLMDTGSTEVHDPLYEDDISADLLRWKKDEQGKQELK